MVCAGIRNDGLRCRARASAAHGFCSFHRSDLADTVRAGRVAGGRVRTHEVAALDTAGGPATLGLDSRGGVQGVLDATLHQLFLGKISPAYAGAVVRLVNAALRNLDHTDRREEDHSLAQYVPNVASLAGMCARLEEEEARANRASAARASEFMLALESLLTSE